MANIGLSNIWWANLTEGANGEASYDGAKTLGKAVSASVSVSNNEAKLYGDDALAESDTSFSNGTITLGVTDDDDAIFAPLLGHSYVDGVVKKNANDVAPYVGVGRVVKKIVNGLYKYKAEFLYKVKFSEPSKDETTQGESIEFSTPSVEGIVATLGNGDWNTGKTFGSKVEALTFIQNILGGTTSYTIVYNANSGSGSVDSVQVTAGDSVVLDDGSGLTPPSGKVFAGWGTNPSATNVLQSPLTPTADMTLYAVYVDE